MNEVWSEGMRCVGPRAIAGALAWLAACSSDPAPTEASGTETDTDDSRPPVCGNGLLEADEECDLGIGNDVGRDCTPECLRPVCGDGRVAPDEQCDPATQGSDGANCTDSCTFAQAWEWKDDWVGSDGLSDRVVGLESTPTGDIVALGTVIEQGRLRSELRSYTADGTRRWVRDLGRSQCESLQPFVATGPGGRTFVTTPGCSGDAEALRALDDAGVELWSIDVAPPDGDVVHTATAVAAGPSGPLVALLAVEDDVGQRQLLAYDTEGNPLWSVETEFTTRDLTVSNGMVYGATSNGDLWARDTGDGSELWFVPLRAFRTVIGASPAGHLAVARDPTDPDLGPKVEVYDSLGVLVWDAELEAAESVPRGRPIGIAADASGNVYLASEGEAPQGSIPTNTTAAVTVFGPSGERLDFRYLDGPAAARDGGSSVLPLDGGGVIVGGEMSVALAGTDGFVARVDPRPRTGRTGELRPGQGQETRWAASARRVHDPDGPRPQTVYVDFDGETLRPGVDAAQAEASCVPAPFEFPALSFPPAYADEAVAHAQRILDAYAVRFVTEQPPGYLPYTRVMVGGAAASLGQQDGRKGFACSVDCVDAARRELVFAFGEATFTSAELGRTIAHEVAHSWGLDHVEETDDLMRAVSAASSDQVLDRCSTLSDDPVCPEAHRVDCTGSGQNAHAELLRALGPRTPDTSAPSVTIDAVEPQRLVAGTPVVVTASATDEQRGAGWRLSVEPLGWSVEAPDDVETMEVEVALPPGAFTLVVEAMDQAGNQATVVREIGVDVPVEPNDVGPQDSDDDGCRIASSPARRSWLWWWVLGAIPRRSTRSRGRRRRRRTRSPTTDKRA